MVYLDLEITNEPTLDFPESIGFMGSIAGSSRPTSRRGDAAAPGRAASRCPPDPVLRLGVTKLGVRARPDRPGAPADFPPETRFWDLLIDGRVEIGPASTVANALFGAEFTDLVLQVAPGSSCSCRAASGSA